MRAIGPVPGNKSLDDTEESKNAYLWIMMRKVSSLIF